MARPTSGIKRDLLRGNFWIHARVDIRNSDGDWKSLTPLLGVNWLTSAFWGMSVDDPGASGQIVLRRDVTQGGTKLSLAPLMTASIINRNLADTYAPLVTAGRRLRIYSAVTVPGLAPAAEDWDLIFSGKIDKADPGGKDNRMTIDIRDLSAYLSSTVLEIQRPYGSPEGTPIQTVMQQILDDTYGADAPVLRVVGAPTKLILPYDQPAGGTVADALKTLALQMGWDVRYLWDESVGDFALTLYEPDRTADTPVFTFGPAEYLDLKGLPISDADVRNVGRLVYFNKAQNRWTSVTVKNQASIDEFGRKFFQLATIASTNIDTEEEALTAITAAIDDLSVPYADQTIETMFFPPVEIADYLGFAANGVHYDEDQAFGVVAWQHALSGEGKGRTLISTRGQPAGGYKNWLNRKGTEEVPPTPNPTIGRLVGAATHYELDVLQRDGIVWLPIKFDAATEYVLVTIKEWPTSPVPAAAGDVRTTSVQLRRPEGTIGKDPEWQTLFGIATIKEWWQRVSAQGVGYGGAASGPVVTQEAQAVDAHPGLAVPGFDATAVIRGVSGNELDWTRTAYAAPPDAVTKVLVWRDDRVLAVLDDIDGPDSLVDDGLSPDSQYQYYFQQYCDGMTGPMVTLAVGTTLPQPPAPLFPPPSEVIPDPVVPFPDLTHPAPQFVDGPVYDTAVHGVYMAWVLDDPGADEVRVQRSLDNSSFTSPFIGPLVGTYTYPGYTASAWFRLASYAAGGTLLAVSQARYYRGVSTPPTSGPGGGTQDPV